MDPNAALAYIAKMLTETRRNNALDREPYAGDAGDRLDYACQDLFDWLARGGFAPTVTPELALAWSYYQTRAVAHARGERVNADDGCAHPDHRRDQTPMGDIFCLDCGDALDD